MSYDSYNSSSTSPHDDASRAKDSSSVEDSSRANPRYDWPENIPHPMPRDVVMDPMALSMGPRTMGPFNRLVPRARRHNVPPSVERQHPELPWDGEIWRRIQRDVDAASLQPCPASDFLPRVGPDINALTIDSDKPVVGDSELYVDEAATFPLVEIWVEFILTPQQVAREGELATACVLAKRATNILTQATDLLIFQGDEARKNDPLFTDRRVHFRSGPAGEGLLGSVPSDAFHQMEVPVILKNTNIFGEETFRAVTTAAARLESLGHYGPNVLILHTIPFADTHAPLGVTLDTPASLLRPLLPGGLRETGSLPLRTGLLISVGGNSMDLLVGCEPKVMFLKQDDEGLFVFRVYQRFALRVKDPTSIMRLDFVAG